MNKDIVLIDFNGKGVKIIPDINGDDLPETVSYNGDVFVQGYGCRNRHYLQRKNMHLGFGE